PLSRACTSCRAACRPSLVSNALTTDLINSLEVGSALASSRVLPVAIDSFRTPNKPLGSAAVTAMPESITLSRIRFHSSGVKAILLAIAAPPCARVVKHRAKACEPSPLPLRAAPQDPQTSTRHAASYVQSRCSDLMADLTSSRHAA